MEEAFYKVIKFCIVFILEMPLIAFIVFGSFVIARLVFEIAIKIDHYIALNKEQIFNLDIDFFKKKGD